MGEIMVGPQTRPPWVRFPSWGYCVGELDLFRGLGMGQAAEQRNPKGRTDLKETKQVGSTELDPNWMKGVRVREEVNIQPEPQDDAYATHRGNESQAVAGEADCEVRWWGRRAPNRAARSSWRHG